MAPIAHFDHQSSLMEVEINCERSAAVDFVLSRWESVKKRDHYTINEDGILILVEARPSAHPTEFHVEKQAAVKIQKIDSSFLSRFKDQSSAVTAIPLVQQTTTNKLDQTPFEQSLPFAAVIKSSPCDASTSKAAPQSNTPKQLVTSAKKGHISNTVSSVAKRRSKAQNPCPPRFRHGDAAIPAIPPPLPGRKNTKLENVPSRYRDKNKKLILALVTDHPKNLFALGNEMDFQRQYLVNTTAILGEGAYGQVKKGVRISDQLPVAIKTINANQVVDFVRLDDGQLCPVEICALNELKNVNGVAQLYDAFHYENKFILVLELMDSDVNGFTLEQSIAKEKQMEESYARYCFADLVNIVRQCELHGIHHRDLKESNILLNSNTEEMKIVDFGCAARTVNSPYSDFIGTLDYMAPEIFAKPCKYEGGPAAVYSLGVILRNLVYGYDGDNPPISNQCTALIEKMLLDCPHKRPTLEDILDDPWMQGA